MPCGEWTVHPRARGERVEVLHDFFFPFGSSPRARGTVIMMTTFLELARFIPARAGNGLKFMPRFFFDAVHPRARGERAMKSRVSMIPGGSSPRARGTAKSRVLLKSKARFIPARAGNGFPFRPEIMRLPVHPRARGERG